MSNDETKTCIIPSNVVKTVSTSPGVDINDLQKMFVEDAPQQVNNLNNAETLSSYVLKLQDLEDDIKMDEENL